MWQVLVSVAAVVGVSDLIRRLLKRHEEWVDTEYRDPPIFEGTDRLHGGGF